MSNHNIQKPPEYKNRERGRVLQDIFNPADQTGFVYEKSYNVVRGAFEDLRHESPRLFKLAADYASNGADLDDERRKRITEILKAKGVGLSDEVTQKIMKDWKVVAYDASYQPKFMLDVGRPVSEDFYNSVAEKINNVRENNGQHAQNLDLLIRSDPSGKSLIFPSKWYKEKIEENERSARQFAQAVRGLSGLDIEAARAYVDRHPAQSLDI